MGFGADEIYRPCDNGTVTDNRTGLVWLANANCIGAVDWHTAMKFVAGLADLPAGSAADCGLSDGSSPGEWRLPSKGEWLAMTEDATGCNPAITNDIASGCWIEGCPASLCSFHGIQSSWYWSSSTVNQGDLAEAWTAYLVDGQVYNNAKSSLSYVWPVRGGQ